MKKIFCIVFVVSVLASQSFSQSRYSGHEKPVIADYVQNIPEELIENGILSKFITLSVPDDDRWNPDETTLNANGSVFAIAEGTSFSSCYLGGHFNSISGIASKGLAFFDDNVKTYTEIGGGVQGGDVYVILPVVPSSNSGELY